MSDLSGVKALIFDVFGTVVDWRTSLINDFTAWGKKRGINADWTALVDGWRAVYAASMDDVASTRSGDTSFSTCCTGARLRNAGRATGITGLNDADLHHLTMGWHRLYPWPDSVGGLTRLKTKYIISPLSNGNVALLTEMAKFAGLPWDLVMSAELFEHYKPDPETYLGAARLLCLPPEQVMMVAAHNHDLKAAQKLGLKTAFVARPDRIRPVAEIRPRGQGRLGHRRQGFWRIGRADGLLIFVSEKQHSTTQGFCFTDSVSVSTRDNSRHPSGLVLSDRDEGPCLSVPDRSNRAAYLTSPGIRDGQERRPRAH